MRSYLIRGTNRFMKEVDRWSKIIAWTALILMTIFFVTLAIITCVRDDNRKSMTIQKDIERTKGLHKYHGIMVSYQDKSGEYFYRNGKRVKL